MPRASDRIALNVSGLHGRTIRGHRVGNSSDFARIAFEEAGVKLVSGADFGSDRHVRISFAASMPALEEAMDRMARLLAS